NREGESIGSFFGYEYYGVNPENGNAIFKTDKNELVQNVAGTTTYRKYDPTNPTDVSVAASLGDKQILGKSLPTWYGGFNNTFRYKGLDFVLNMVYAGGNKVYNQTRQEALNNMSFQNGGKELLDRWTPNNKQTDVPKVVYGHQASINLEGRMNSRFLENGNFLRMKTIGVGYSFNNAPFLSSIHLSSLRVYANVENAFVVTKYSGIDPEVANSFTTNSQSALDNRGNMIPRTFTLGLNVGF